VFHHLVILKVVFLLLFLVLVNHFDVLDLKDTQVLRHAVTIWPQLKIQMECLDKLILIVLLLPKKEAFKMP
jgi:hypothetical protein